MSFLHQEDEKIINRTAIVGSLLAALGFFLLPLVELRANRIASGLTFNMLEFTDDLRLFFLFALALVPFALAFRRDRQSRAWLLALVANLLLIFTLLLPAQSGKELLTNVDQYFPPQPQTQELIALTPGENTIEVEDETSELRFLLYSEVYPVDAIASIMQPPQSNPNTGELRPPAELIESDPGLTRESEGNLIWTVADPLPGHWTFEINRAYDDLEIYVQPILAGETARAPRLLPSAAIAIGLLGAYIILFGAMADLRAINVRGLPLIIAGWGGIALIAAMFASGTFNTYSIMVELQNNGQQLEERFLEHITFVAISILSGCVIGVSLGLWASRDERVAPVILYTVGIIQTIPSLALFGLLLEPLAQFGDLPFIGPAFLSFGDWGTDVDPGPFEGSTVAMLEILLVTTAVAAVLMLFYVAVSSFFRSLPDRDDNAARLRAGGQNVLLILAAIGLAIPLAIGAIAFVSFLFRITFVFFTEERLVDERSLVLISLAISLVIVFIRRRVDAFRDDKFTTRIRKTRVNVLNLAASLIIIGLPMLLLVTGLVESANIFLENVDSPQALSMRDLGVSGIGVAPALIALTLYALLPLVRNTYAGLNNVDPAIIDSGKGMGMTPAQIFFRIELPLAFPVIMAGIRNAGVALVGIGTIATVIGAGGLGDLVLQGISNTSIDLILLGAIPAVFLAALLDIGLRAIESVLTSPGIKQTEDI